MGCNASFKNVVFFCSQ
jgi:hypothetical protein